MTITKVIEVRQFYYSKTQSNSLTLLIQNLQIFLKLFTSRMGRWHREAIFSTPPCKKKTKLRQFQISTNQITTRSNKKTPINIVPHKYPNTDPTPTLTTSLLRATLMTLINLTNISSEKRFLKEIKSNLRKLTKISKKRKRKRGRVVRKIRMTTLAKPPTSPHCSIYSSQKQNATIRVGF